MKMDWNTTLSSNEKSIFVLAVEKKQTKFMITEHRKSRIFPLLATK